MSCTPDSVQEVALGDAGDGGATIVISGPSA
jgi:hypothetical protein